MQDTLANYIKIIGRGQRAGRSLTQEEAYRAYQLILANQVTQAQLGAFLMLLRVREETPQEIAGFVQASREALPTAYRHIHADIDIGVYAGKRRHLPWYVAAVLCLVQAGYRVFLHGTSETESQRLYMPAIAQALNLPVAYEPHQANHKLSQYGLVYCDLASLLPALNQLMAMRAELGLRSSTNTIARMLNPTQALFCFHGVHHRHVDSKHVHTAQLLQDKHVACIRGEGGDPEYKPERESVLHLQRQGEISTCVFPALLAQWQIKPRQLQISEFIEVWRGQLTSTYGEAATIGTLAQYLMLLENNGVEASLAKARQLWESRDKTRLDSVGCAA